MDELPSQESRIEETQASNLLFFYISRLAPVRGFCDMTDEYSDLLLWHLCIIILAEKRFKLKIANFRRS
jgi:hypothetical protein